MHRLGTRELFVDAVRGSFDRRLICTGWQRQELFADADEGKSCLMIPSGEALTRECICTGLYRRELFADVVRERFNWRVSCTGWAQESCLLML